MIIVLETNIGLIDSPVRIPAGDAQVTSILTSSTAGGTATVRAESGTGLKNDVAVRYVWIKVAAQAVQKLKTCAQILCILSYRGEKCFILVNSHLMMIKSIFFV
ncbi:MAG: hypothetical protein C5S41_06370 [Candidatus Methanomarinus sp.]|jgi:hypothetical protein|nr:MAG: hypothetical protein C5S41_06370 [ANME-2 cluster archaeon]KAF5425549.1 hypothetical protein C5S42_10320 [ANME-2 cluster archaeon]